MKIIIRAWKGEEKLWKVFWLFLVLGNICLSVLDIMVEGHGFIAEQASNVIFYVYSVWVLVSCWRCAFNVRKKLWGYAARVIAAILFLLMVLSLLAIMGMAAFFGLSNMNQLVRAGPDMRQDLESCEDRLNQGAATAGLNLEEYRKQHEEEYKDCLAKAISVGMGQQLGAVMSAVEAMAPADKPKACEEGMTAYAQQHGLDPAIYFAQTSDVGGWCSPSDVDAIRAKFAASPDPEVRSKYAKARQSLLFAHYIGQNFARDAQYFPPGMYADGRKGVCTYKEFRKNQPTGGSYFDNVTFDECVREFVTTARTWCISAVKELPVDDTIPAGAILMTQEFHFGPPRTPFEKPGPDEVVVARHECRKPALADVSSDSTPKTN